MSEFTVATAWRPTLRELSALLRVAYEDRINCSHASYGQWSFWAYGNPFHASLCHKYGAFYLTDVTKVGSLHWASKGQVLAALGLQDYEV